MSSKGKGWDGVRKRLDIFLSVTTINRTKVIYIYRYFSLLLTTAFYIFGRPGRISLSAICVVIFLVLSAQMITYLYVKSINNRFLLTAAVLGETIGMTFLLVPTGGMESPFIWYALNPILVAGSFISPFFCWIIIILYIISASIISSVLLYPAEGIFHNIAQSSDFILIFSLITLVVQLLLQFTGVLEKRSAELESQSRKLHELNEILNHTNEKLHKALWRIMSLYKSVETFNTMNNLETMTKSLADYSAKLTERKHAFFWIPEKYLFISNEVISGEQQIVFLNELEKIWENISSNKIRKVSIGECKYLVAVIRTPSKNYGFLGVDMLSKTTEIGDIQLLSFLSDLSGVLLERLYLEEVANSMLIIEEQNRIANEMHDSVTQRLFSISCGLFGLSNNWNTIEKEQAKKQLELIRQNVNKAMKEIRSAIYRLSSRKKGRKEYFINSLKSYFSNLEDLNGIQVEMVNTGDEEFLTTAQKNAIYRILLESTGNAIRHGGCSKINVKLTMKPDAVILTVSDDGTGFNTGSIEREENFGLGIANMRNLTVSLGGIFDLKSKIGEGTIINIIIPVKETETISPIALQNEGA